VCATLLAGGAWLAEGAVRPGLITWVLGAVGGFFFATSLIVIMAAIGRAGITTTTAVYRMSLVWPVLISVVVFRELPNVFQALGIVLALLAILLLTVSTNPQVERFSRLGGLLLLGLFVLGGGPFSTLKVFSEVGPPEQKQALLMAIFFFAGVMCWAVIIARRIPLRGEALTSGAMFGTFNVMSNLSLLYGLQTVPGTLAFPLFNAGIILLATLLGVVIWKERPGPLGSVALAVALLAIVLMNV